MTGAAHTPYCVAHRQRHGEANHNEWQATGVFAGRCKCGCHAVEAAALAVDTAYDRQTRSWITVLQDARGYQVGDSYYDGTRADRDASRGQAARRADYLRQRHIDDGHDEPFGRCDWCHDNAQAAR